MKYLFISLIALLALNGCDTQEEAGNDKECMAAGLASCLNPSTMVFKTKNGFETGSLSDVTFVMIEVYPDALSNDETLTRTFHDEEAGQVVKKLSLFKPIDQGMPLSFHTGRITIVYKDSEASGGEKTRSLLIENSTLLQDVDYPIITYRPSVKLDRDWLESL